MFLNFWFCLSTHWDVHAIKRTHFKYKIPEGVTNVHCKILSSQFRYHLINFSYSPVQLIDSHSCPPINFAVLEHYRNGIVQCIFFYTCLYHIASFWNPFIVCPCVLPFFFFFFPSSTLSWEKSSLSICVFLVIKILWTFCRHKFWFPLGKSLGEEFLSQW